MSQPDRSRPLLASALKNPVIRLFASLKVGVTLLALLLVYACVFSALPQVRGALELTEMRAFSHWLFAGLVYLLCVSVTIATLTRIRLNLENAGVLTVHAGLLLLCGGSLWYFGGKVEGDILLSSPRVELLTLGPPPRVVASLPTEAGKRWSTQAPGLGGEISLEIVDAKIGSTAAEGIVAVRVRIGEAEPRLVTFMPVAEQANLSDRLALRWRAPQPVRTFYDQERPALFARPAAQSGWRPLEVQGLPLFRERYLDEGYVLVDTENQPARSKRTSPVLRLGGFSLPTHWFEHWRMPIDVAIPDAPFDVAITGFVPYAAGMRMTAVRGGTAHNPAITLQLASPDGKESLQRSLLAASPAASWLGTDPPVEFRFANSPEQREAWLSPQVGGNELTIELKDPPLKKTVALSVGETIALEGTAYELTLQQVFPNWPLMSPGFENVATPAALVEVKSAQKRYTRTVIQRFPELSQDIDEQGMRRKDGPYDPNLLLGFRGAANGRVLIVADADSATTNKLALGAFDPSGQVQRLALQTGSTQRLSIGPVRLDLQVAAYIPQARMVDMPVLETLERRRPNLAARAASVIRLQFKGKGANAGWSDAQWCAFSQYPDDPTRVIRVQPPEGPAWELLYSRLPHDLGAWLTPNALHVNFFPGRQSVESWRSDFWVSATRDGERKPAFVQTNQTHGLGAWTLFQSGAAEDHWSYTILGVGNRLGISPMLLGCVMITLGSMYAFYIKPVLRRRRLAAAAAFAARSAQRAAVEPAETELVEMMRNGR